MTIERPSLSELKERIKADYQAKLPGAAVAVRRGNIEVQSTVDAATAHLQYGFIQDISKQILPDSAKVEYLERHAGIWGLTRKQASASTGELLCTGTNGSVIPAGTVWERADGIRYVTDSDATISSGSASVAVTAEDAGADGDYEAEAQLTLVGYVAGLDQLATVGAEGLAGGADIESDDDLRGRIIERIQEPPHGGSLKDYIRWAKEISGVTRVFVYPERTGEGTVGVTVLTDNATGGPIPAQQVIDDVQAHIDQVRPVTAAVSVFACVAAPVDFSIEVSPDTAAIRTAVESELADFFLRESEPEGALKLSRIGEAISQAAGEFSHHVTSPAADPEAGAGELLTLGEITWS